MNRSNLGDKTEKDSSGKIIIEYLAYTCKKCGAKWKQRIDYRKVGRKVIKWIKVA
jgi:hypothetical protein